MDIDYKMAKVILGLQPDEVSDADKIKKAYREIAKAVHPDVNREATAGRFNGLFALVGEAYEVVLSAATNGACAQEGPGARRGSGPDKQGQRRPYPYEDDEVYTRSSRAAQEASNRNKKVTVEISFADLLKMYSGPLTTTSTAGETVVLQLAKLWDYDVIIKDLISVRVDIEGMSSAPVISQEFRRSYTPKDVYSLEIRRDLSGLAPDNEVRACHMKLEFTVGSLEGFSKTAEVDGLRDGVTVTLAVGMGNKVLVEFGCL